MQALLNLWRIPELRNRILFTLGMLVIYRIGYHIPLPAVDTVALKAAIGNLDDKDLLKNVMAYMSTFTGGSLSQSTIFALGVAPYISASIIIQLLSTVLPDLKALRKEGASGQQKIMEYTRYLTIALCIGQGIFVLINLRTMAHGIVYPEFEGSWVFWVGCTVALTGGAMFLMWLGEQIDRYGMGNGVSLIITAGIVATMPDAASRIYQNFHMTGDKGGYDPMKVAFIAALFVIVVAGSIVITQSQRRIPIQQAKHTKGSAVVGGQKMYLPLKVNHGGVMPVIFASTLMMFPGMILKVLGSRIGKLDEYHSAFGRAYFHTVEFLAHEFEANRITAGFLYILVLVGLIYFFSFFWTSVQFNPEETSTQLRDSGSFIPGLRPGPRTAEYLEAVMERLTYAGAAFLCVIAVLPNLASHGMQLTDSLVIQFMGGTSILICVSVVLDFVQRIEAQLMMRNYSGFLSQGDGEAPKVKAIRGETADIPE